MVAFRFLSLPPPHSRTSAKPQVIKAWSRGLIDVTSTDAEIITDARGRIVDVGSRGAEILNLSPRGVRGRDLSLFVVRDRAALKRQLDVAARGHMVVLETILQPRERQQRRAVVRISRLEGDDAEVALQWRIELL